MIGPDMLDRGASAKNWEPRTSKTSNVLSYAILLGGVITIGFSAYLVVVSYSSLPAWDGWIQLHFAANRRTIPTLTWLWNQHYDHRLVIPKLFLLADLRWFQARQVFLLVSIFVIQLLHLLVLGWSMRVLGGWSGALWAYRFRTGCVLSLWSVAVRKSHLGLSDLLCPARSVCHSFVCWTAALLDAIRTIIRGLGILEVSSPFYCRSTGSDIFAVQRKCGLAVAGGCGPAATTAPCGGSEFGDYGRGEYCSLPPRLHSLEVHRLVSGDTGHSF